MKLGHLSRETDECPSGYPAFRSFTSDGVPCWIECHDIEHLRAVASLTDQEKERAMAYLGSKLLNDEAIAELNLLAQPFCLDGAQDYFN